MGKENNEYQVCIIAAWATLGFIVIGWHYGSFLHVWWRSEITWSQWLGFRWWCEIAALWFLIDAGCVFRRDWWPRLSSLHLSTSSFRCRVGFRCKFCHWVGLFPKKYEPFRGNPQRKHHSFCPIDRLQHSSFQSLRGYDSSLARASSKECSSKIELHCCSCHPWGSSSSHNSWSRQPSSDCKPWVLPRVSAILNSHFF